MTPTTGYKTFERWRQAVQDVTRLLLKTTSILEQAQVPFAIVGGNSVAAWIEQINPKKIRSTQDVDLLMRRSDLPLAIQALEAAGYTYHEVMQVTCFLEEPDDLPSDSVHILWANEKVRGEYVLPNPDVTDSVQLGEKRVIELEKLVLMKLNSFRIKDQTHLLDLRDVGLIDQTWPAKYPPVLAARLQQILDNTDG